MVRRWNLVRREKKEEGRRKIRKWELRIGDDSSSVLYGGTIAGPRLRGEDKVRSEK